MNQSESFHVHPTAPTDLERRLAEALAPQPLLVILTDNKYTMLSVKRSGGGFILRVHHMFASADPFVVNAIATYLRTGDGDASRLLSSFIDANQAKIRRRRVRSVHESLTPKGKHFDLQEIYAAINAHYFAGTIDAHITWGAPKAPEASARRRNSIKMGSYSVEDRLIRIHPSLDRAFVPRYFVEWIVYHEMLHQKHPIPTVAGRRQFHTPAFLAEERLFADYERARQWERRNLHRLLVF